MDNFLGCVTRDLYGRYGNGISAIKILLPNNRSRLFFMDELSKCIESPIWQPQYTSIDELMSTYASIEHIDRIRAVVELYKVYSKYHKETFDSFYFWGEMLLTDFDAIDKYMIDADMLFSNVLDLKEIDADLSYLSPEQRSVIKRFWIAFESGEQSEQKEKFISVWKTLSNVYHEFKDNLSAINAGYTGMVQRIAAEILKSGNENISPHSEHYAVVGFNALSECEKILFDYLQRNHTVDFYWDYDDYYINDERQEAALFVRENLKRYPQHDDFVLKSHFAEHKEMIAISTASDSLQCKYVRSFLDEIIATEGTVDKHTAIVLTDENLLTPLLYSLPDYVGKVNVTMGYPLKQSLAYAFVERLLMLQHRMRIKSDGGILFYHADVLGILRHAYLTDNDQHQIEEIADECVTRGQIYIPQQLLQVNDLTSKIFVGYDNWQDFAAYIIEVLSYIESSLGREENTPEKLQQREFFETIANGLNRLSNSLYDCKIDISVATFSMLARKILQTVRIPYSGEPLMGVQVMGILETRNLDFENVVILSMNDDTFPSSRFNNSSYIPYNLRFAYGMPTPRESEGVYAYYFYRLIQRARKVHLVYCSKSDENSSGEQSRYIYQLDYESPHNLLHREVGIDVNLSPVQPIEVAKTGEISKRLEQYYVENGKEFSPSSFNTYMECPLKFYFRTIAGFKIKDEISEDVDLPMFGTILHRTMELLYTPILDVHNPISEINKMIDSKNVEDAILQAVTESYFHGERVNREEWGGNLVMVADTVSKYVNHSILPYDSSHNGYKIIGLEEKLRCSLHFNDTNNIEHTVTFSGKSDRIDMMDDGTIRIIDYKTGSIHRDFNGIAELLGESREAKNGAVLQTFLYSMMVDRMQQTGAIQGHDVCPSLYYVRGMNDRQYAPFLNDKSLGGEVHKYSQYKKELEEYLFARLRELFDMNIPFRQTDKKDTCKYCDFSIICRKR